MLENINLSGTTVTGELHAYMYDAIFNQYGVFNYGNTFAHEIISNNQINIKDGLAINQGRIARIPIGSHESVLIENGTSGVSRVDLIVLHFETNGITESQTIRVIKGENGSTTIPTYAQSNTFADGQSNDMPLYSIKLNGLNIEKVTRLFTVIDTYALLKKNLEAAINDKSPLNHYHDDLTTVYVDKSSGNFNDFYKQGKTTVHTTIGDLDNAPNSTNEFVVITTAHGDGLAAVQLAMTIQHPVRMYARRYMNGEWYAWTEFYSKAYKPTPAEIGAAASSDLGTQVTYSLSGTTLTITTK